MVKILIAQINPILGDFEGNLKQIEKSLLSIKDFDIAVFPEMSLPGYLPSDLILDSTFIKKQNLALERLKNIVKDKLIVVGGIDSSEGEKPFFNTAFLIYEGKIQARYHKMCLPTYDVFDEKRYFSEGKDPLVFEHMGKKFGISICEDIWASQNLVKETHYSHHPFDHYKDVDAMINISASPYVKNKFLTRFDLLQKVAKKYKAPIFYSCQVGGQDGVLFDGGSFVVNQRGEFVDHLQFFKEDEKVFDLNNLIKGDLPQFPIFEEIENAIIMGLRDFFYKQGFKGCLVGLSGGIDSSLTLYLCVKAFGAQSVYGFMIPSLFTSDMNIEDSTKLAKKLNVEIKSAPLGKVLTELEEMVKAQTSYQLKDLTHQNMQARLRGLFLMAMSNQTDHLVITTGNKSELAMGYATLYGDMCGAIAPLGDLLKTEVYGLAKHIQSKEEIFPKRIFIKAPSAELAFNQKDEDNLPPYPVLDQILSLFLEQGYSIEKIIEMTKIQREVVTWVIHKLFQMEFKRQQYAPVLKVSSKTFNLGRKMPIVQKFYKSNF